MGLSSLALFSPPVWVGPGVAPNRRGVCVQFFVGVLPIFFSGDVWMQSDTYKPTVNLHRWAKTLQEIARLTQYFVNRKVDDLPRLDTFHELTSGNRSKLQLKACDFRTKSDNLPSSDNVLTPLKTI